MSRILAGGALLGFFVAVLVVVLVSATSGGDGSTATTVARPTPRATTTRPARTVKKPVAKPIALSGAGAYDPFGDEHENDDLAPLAVDDDPTTFWKTEHYLRGFSKPGVGLLLDLRRRRSIAKVVVVTDSPGASARIDLGDSATGPFEPASAERPLRGTTAFPLTKGAAGRYVVVWLTAVPEPAGEAHVTEVRAEAPPA